jgi:glycosyltransferase involved in cell wall biosynthesis
VIDGGSSDNSVEIIRKHSGQIKYWVSEKDSGQSEAINKGFKQTSGDIVTWLNSDDYYEPGTLAFVAETFSGDAAISILHGKTIFFGKQIKSKIIGLDRDLAPHEYLPFMRFPQPSSFFRKDAINAVSSVNAALHYVMDFELVSRAILRGFKVKRTDKILSRYRLHPKSKSNHDLAFLSEWSLVARNILDSIPGGETFARKLEQLQITNASRREKYACSINPTRREVEEIFLLHLNIYYHIHYRHHLSEECERISAYLKANHPAFFASNNYEKYNSRLKFIPKFVFRLVRHLSN